MTDTAPRAGYGAAGPDASDDAALIMRSLRAPECFVTEHRFELGFRRGESEPKRHASDGKLTE